MKRLLSLCLFGLLSGTAAAQELTPPDHTKAEVIAATKFCLEAFREQKANAKRFFLQEFDTPIYSEADVLSAFTACVLYHLEGKAAEVVPLT